MKRLSQGRQNMRPRHFQIFSSRSLPAKSLMELRQVLELQVEVVSVVDDVPVVVDDDAETDSV